VEQGKKEQTDSELMTLRFLAMQLSATIAIAFPCDLRRHGSADTPGDSQYRKEFLRAFP